MIKAVKELTAEQKKDIWELVKAADHEFYPPLSTRELTTQKDLTNKVDQNEPTQYFNALMDQSFILCIKKRQVVGFLSFIPDYHLATDARLDLKCDYVSTIIVSEKNR